jgi:alkylated DNA repair protein alkB homolog 1
MMMNEEVDGKENMLYRDQNPVNSGLHDHFRAEEKRIRKSWREYESNRLNSRKRKGNDQAVEDSYEFVRSMGIETFEASSSIEISGLSSRILPVSSLMVDSKATVYRPPGTPDGLYVIKHALSLGNQLYWANIAVNDYSKASHTNLTNLSHLSTSQTINSSSSGNSSHTEDYSDLWSQSILENNDFALFKSLRWASLGYHYDWTARRYQKDLLSPFPSNLAAYCLILANHVGHSLTAEAAIVNYYPSGTSMSGHLDDAELTMEEPIVSISIGCPALFLIGGRTKDILPTTILLESGDVVVMADESRYCYHGVPIVLPHSHSSSQPFRAIDKSSSYYHVANYLCQGRININVRRVLPPGAEWIDRQGSGAKPQASSSSSESK